MYYSCNFSIFYWSKKPGNLVADIVHIHKTSLVARTSLKNKKFGIYINEDNLRTISPSISHPIFSFQHSLQVSKGYRVVSNKKLKIWSKRGFFNGLDCLDNGIIILLIGKTGVWKPLTVFLLDHFLKKWEIKFFV